MGDENSVDVNSAIVELGFRYFVGAAVAVKPEGDEYIVVLGLKYNVSIIVDKLMCCASLEGRGNIVVSGSKYAPCIVVKVRLASAGRVDDDDE